MLNADGNLWHKNCNYDYCNSSFGEEGYRRHNIQAGTFNGRLLIYFTGAWMGHGALSHPTPNALLHRQSHRVQARKQADEGSIQSLESKELHWSRKKTNVSPLVVCLDHQG